jgi:hypothetical protein
VEAGVDQEGDDQVGVDLVGAKVDQEGVDLEGCVRVDLDCLALGGLALLVELDGFALLVDLEGLEDHENLVLVDLWVLVDPLLLVLLAVVQGNLELLNPLVTV